MTTETITTHDEVPIQQLIADRVGTKTRDLKYTSNKNLVQADSRSRMRIAPSPLIRLWLNPYSRLSRSHIQLQKPERLINCNT